MSIQFFQSMKQIEVSIISIWLSASIMSSFNASQYYSTDKVNQMLSTARKIQILKNSDPPGTNLQAQFIFDHLQWLSNTQNFHTQSDEKQQKENRSHPNQIQRNKSCASIASRLNYKRGYKPQRNLYKRLLEELAQFQKMTLKLKSMSCSQICEYRNKYLGFYLNRFFEQVKSQCHEKSIFIQKLFAAISHVMEQAFERLYKHILAEQKGYLKNVLQIHQEYQSRLQHLTHQLKLKDQKLKSFQNYYSSLAKKNKEKKKKNKNLSQNLLMAGLKIAQIEDRRSLMKTQYIKMLTIGFQGGLTYEQAHNQVMEQFYFSQIGSKINKSEILSLKQQFSSETRNLPESNQSHCEQQAMNVVEGRDYKRNKKNRGIQVYMSNDNLVSFDQSFGIREKYQEKLIQDKKCQTFTQPLLCFEKSTQSGGQKKKKLSIEQNVLFNYQPQKALFDENIFNQCAELDEQSVESRSENRIGTDQKQEKEESLSFVYERMSKNQSTLIKRKKPKKMKNRKKSILPSNFKRQSSIMKKGTPQTIEEVNVPKKRSNQHKISLNFKLTSQNPPQKNSSDVESESSTSQSQSIIESSISEKEEDYKQTDLVGVIQNMQNVSPTGIYIDETMLFLLKKSLFRVQHYKIIKQNRLIKKNSKFLTTIRSSLNELQNDKRVSTTLSIKNIIKIICIIYEAAYAHICECEALQKKPQVNLLKLLKDSVQKQYPIFQNSTQQLNRKIASITRSMELYSMSNYMIKNFIMLSSLDENIYSPIIFQQDIIFYFSLLKQLNVGPEKKLQLGVKGNGQLNFEQIYTTVEKLKYVLEKYVKQVYRKRQLNEQIQKRVNNIFENINKGVICQETRLDIYKCSQLILDSILSCKLEVLKSYSKLVYVPDITHKSLITQELFIDLLGFLNLTKLQKLNIINRFRYAYGKKKALEGISVINFVNFCIQNNIPDFDSILVYVRKYSILPPQVDKKSLENNPNFSGIERIAKYCYEQEQKTYKQLFVGAEKMVHSKIIELQASDLLEKVIGQHFTSLYITSLCLLEEKKANDL